MAINWFPGHMHKARKEIAQVMPQVDLVIEVLDARIPFSSENPLVPQLRQDTPALKILNKSDLADPEVTAQWLAYLERDQGVKAVACSQQDRSHILSLLDLCCTMVPHRNLDKKPLRAMILGIPNVGKSTLLNTLAGRILAKTGNEPAVTKAQQRIKLPNNISLHDTPGFLWPKLEPEACGYRLAVTGAIKDALIEHDDIALFACDYMLENYQERLQNRYQLQPLPNTGIELMESIAAKRGCLAGGGRTDYDKVGKLILNEIRSGKLGQLSFETPAML